MIFGKTNLELKVGIFVFTALVILAIFILSIGGFKTWSSGYRVNFIFNFVNGVKMGAPVRFAGVDIGEVKEIRLIFDKQQGKEKVVIQCWIRKDANIPMDSQVWVETLGLLGEKYIEIMPGENYGQCLAVNQTLTGQDPLPMHEITNEAKRIGDNLEQILASVNKKEGTIGKLIYDDSLYEELKMMVIDTRQRLDLVLDETQGMVSDIRKNPWKLLHKTRGKDKCAK